MLELGRKVRRFPAMNTRKAATMTTTIAHPSAHALDALADAHALSVDALARCKAFAEWSEPQLRSVAETCVALHKRHATDLATMLVSLERVPQMNGTFVADPSEATLPAFVSGRGNAMAARITNGERQLAAAFDKVLERRIPDPQSRQIAAMKAEIDALTHDKMTTA